MTCPVRRMVIILDLAILGSMDLVGNPAQLTAADTKPANGTLATPSAAQVLRQQRSGCCVNHCFHMDSCLSAVSRDVAASSTPCAD